MSDRGKRGGWGWASCWWEACRTERLLDRRTRLCWRLKSGDINVHFYKDMWEEHDEDTFLCRWYSFINTVTKYNWAPDCLSHSFICQLSFSNLKINLICTKHNVEPEIIPIKTQNIHINHVWICKSANVKNMFTCLCVCLITKSKRLLSKC